MRKETTTASRIGMVVCPSCRTPTRVLESRRAPDGDVVRRRRECPSCGRRFTTFERRDPEPAYVIKRDGERQRFDRTKLRGALLAAAHKRPITAMDVEAIVDRIEVAAADSGELSTERILELCLTELRDLDVGAYMQFAGTLAEPPSAISGQTSPTSPSGSVRVAREDPESPPKAAARRGLDD
jgi:transcriptional repressor NrdR